VFRFFEQELSDATVEICKLFDLPSIDILSPTMAALSTAFEREPDQPTVMPFLPDHVFELASAVEYTLNHDDGKGLDTLAEADVIILGISRCGKTPTCVFLSCRKIKAANVPIVEGFPLAEQVRQAKVPKVGFRVSLERQLKLRGEMSQRMGATIPGYSDRRSVFREIEYCNQIYRTIPGLKTLDVSSMAVEEVADWVARNVL
jgi:regulator of PEP synthase PpsR (kinase-PPPase family)